MRDTHYVICDALSVKLQKRGGTYIKVKTRFRFLLKENLFRNENMMEIKTLISI